jgi:CRISPR-associated protein Csh1
VTFLLAGVLQLGQYALNKKSTDTEEYLQIIENPNDKGNYNHVLKIAFESTEGNIVYRGVEYEEFSSKKINNHAYKKGSARGGDITPTSKYTDSTKTLNKIMISFNDILKSANQNDDEQKIFKSIYEYMVSNQENIANDITEKIKSIPLKKGESCIVTITLIENNNERCIDDSQPIKNYLAGIFDGQYCSKYGKTSKGKGICCYCKNESEVFRFVTMYDSSTFDKVGLATYFFKQENARKNLFIDIENQQYSA